LQVKDFLAHNMLRYPVYLSCCFINKLSVFSFTVVFSPRCASWRW